MNTTVFLHKGYFWSAGKQYGWPETDPGVGIALAKVKKALPFDRIFVKSRYDYMSISAKKAIEYGKEMVVGKSRKILVIPKSKFVKESIY